VKPPFVAAATAASCAFVSAIASAEMAAASESIEEVVVVANRAPTPVDKVGNSVTVLDQSDIRQSQAVVTSDLLAQTPGLTVARVGGVGRQRR
jgi:vitamin B12 transporter